MVRQKKICLSGKSLEITKITALSSNVNENDKLPLDIMMKKTELNE